MLKETFIDSCSLCVSLERTLIFEALSNSRPIFAGFLLALYSLILFHGFSGHVHQQDGTSIHVLTEGSHDHEHHHIHFSDLLHKLIDLVSHTDIGADHLETYVAQKNIDYKFAAQQFSLLNIFAQNEVLEFQAPESIISKWLYKPPPDLQQQQHVLSLVNRGPPSLS